MTSAILMIVSIGPMNSEEIDEFERNLNLKEIIQVRYLDDAGKRADMTTPSFAHFAPMVQQIVDTHTDWTDRAPSGGV